MFILCIVYSTNSVSAKFYSCSLNNSLAGAEQIEDEDCSLDNVDNGQLDIQRHHPRIANIDCILKTIATALTQRYN